VFDSKNPLWLPKGSVRAILALGVVSGYSYLCVTTSNLEALGLVAVLVMQNYFNKKDNDSINNITNGNINK